MPTWSDKWKYTYGECRLITAIDWPVSVRAAQRKNENGPWNHDDRSKKFAPEPKFKSKPLRKQERAALAKAAGMTMPTL